MADDVAPYERDIDDETSFEEFGHDNGNRWWWQSDLAALLGYSRPQTFQKAVGKAISACTTLDIPVLENFEHVTRTLDDGREVSDCKLSRFACYLTAMNADPRKPEVARAQAYFAGLAEAARQYVLHTDNVERVLIRDEVTEASKAMIGAAKVAGVHDFAVFQNEGYRGLYNLNLRQLMQRKGIPQKKTLFDFMGKEELAANLFRLTQTEAQVKKHGVQGQTHANRTAFHVGRQVRKTIDDIGGTPPEYLPTAEDIRQVRSGLKKARRQFEKMDRKKSLPAPPADDYTDPQDDEET